MASRRTFIAAVLTLTVAVAATSAVSPAAGNERAKRAPTPIRVDAMHGRASVSGRVFDESGKPLVGARVSVYGLADLLESQGSYEFAWVATPPAPRGTATTDAAGRYSVTDLVRGMNVVRVETEGGDRSAALATAIEDRPVAITLRTVSSHVVIRGIVVDESGAGIASAPVVAEPDTYIPCTAALLGLAMETARTTANGSGEFEVQTAAKPVFVAAMRPRDGRWAARRWGTGDRDPAGPIRIAFAGGPGLAARVQGARTGRPIPGALAMAVSQPKDANDLWFLHSARSGSDGGLAFPEFPALGQGGFVLLAPGIGGDWQDATVPFDGLLKVRRGATLRGHIRDSRGTPVVGASVVAHAFSWPALRTTTDETGAYAIEGLPRTRPGYADPMHQANGGMFVWVEAPGYSSEPGIEILQVPADAASVEQSFVLREGVTIRGRAEGVERVEGVGWAPGEFGPYEEMLFTRGTGIGEDGAFVLTDLPPGRVTLKVSESRQVVVDDLKAGEVREGVVIPRAK